jgi:hypothetical protein
LKKEIALVRLIFKLKQGYGVVESTRRVTTGHDGDDGRRAILPVSACDTNASIRANI